MLSLQNVFFHWGPQPVLAGVSLFVGRGQKVGLAGANGAGKTTLLQIAAGLLRPDRGNVSRPRAAGYLAQEPELPPEFGPQATIRDVVVAASPAATLARALDEAELRLHTASGEALDRAVAEYGRLEEQYRLQGGYEVEAEAGRVLGGLGLGQLEPHHRVGDLSAGERTRLEMARVLVGGYDLLLLDEPTNHLDTDGTAWLMQFLARSEAAVLLISHDLRLLDRSISRVYELELQTRQITEFKGTYSAYLEWSEQRRAVLKRTRARQLGDIDRLQATADKFRAYAHKSEKMARRAKVMDRRIERMQETVTEAPVDPKTLRLQFGRAPRSGRVALRVRGLEKSYGAVPVLRGISFELERGEHLAVLGVNGAGKSTLLDVITGRTAADAGAVELGHNVSLGYFAHELAGDQARLTPYAHLQPLVKGGETHIRSLLARLLFGEDHIFRPTQTLSVGERARLGLAKLMLRRHNLLILDEPNANLDAGSRDWLLEALDEYGASVIAVSHDRDFVAGLRPARVLTMPEGDFGAFQARHLELVEAV